MHLELTTLYVSKHASRKDRGEDVNRLSLVSFSLDFDLFTFSDTSYYFFQFALGKDSQALV